jgi:hypothetical protein
MPRYTHFIKLKYLIFSNGGSMYILCCVTIRRRKIIIKNTQGALAAPTREDGACYLQSFFWYVHKESSKFVLVSLLGTRWCIGWKQLAWYIKTQGRRSTGMLISMCVLICFVTCDRVAWWCSMVPSWSRWTACGERRCVGLRRGRSCTRRRLVVHDGV